MLYVKKGNICEHEVEDHLLGLLQGQCVVLAEQAGHIISPKVPNSSN